MRANLPCADPGIFVRGGGVQVSLTKKALTTLFFFIPQLIYRSETGQFQRNLSCFKVPGGPTFTRGGGGGVGSKCLFPIETHINCDFLGGPDPLSPPSGSALVCAFVILIGHKDVYLRFNLYIASGDRLMSL